MAGTHLIYYQDATFYDWSFLLVEHITLKSLDLVPSFEAEHHAAMKGYSLHRYHSNTISKTCFLYLSTRFFFFFQLRSSTYYQQLRLFLYTLQQTTHSFVSLFSWLSLSDNEQRRRRLHSTLYTLPLAMVAMSLYNYDLEITKIAGYTFESPKLLEGVDNVAIAYGQRYESTLFSRVYFPHISCLTFSVLQNQG